MQVDADESTKEVQAARALVFAAACRLPDERPAVSRVRVALAVVLLCLAAAAPAQMPTLPGISAAPNAEPFAAEPAPVGDPAVELRRRLDAAEAELARIQAPGGHAAGAPPGTDEADLTSRHFLTRQLVQAYRSHLSELIGLRTARQQHAQASARARSWSGFAEPPPYSMLLVDGLRLGMQRDSLRVQGIEVRQRMLATQLDSVRTQLRKYQEDARRWHEAFEAAGADPPRAAQARWKTDLALLGERAAIAVIAAHEAALEVLAAELDTARADFDLAERKLRQAEGKTRFSAEDLAEVQRRIEARRSAREAELEAALPAQAALDQALADKERELAAQRAAVDALRTELAATRDKLREVQGRVEADRQSPTAPSDDRAAAREQAQARAAEARARARLPVLETSLARDVATIDSLRREAELLGLKARNARVQIELLGSLITSAEIQTAFWALRYAAAGDEPSAARKQPAIADSGRALLDRLTPARDYMRHQLELTMTRIAEQQDALAAAPNSAEAAHARAMTEALREREQGYLRALAETEELRLLMVRWTEEFAQHIEAQGGAARVRLWWARGEAAARQVWQFELFAVEDSVVIDGRKVASTRGVTVGKVVQAVLIVVLGYVVLRLLSRLLRKAAVRHWGGDTQKYDLVSKWVTAAAMVVLLLVSLDVVNIPLTAFAFLGGAIAIGAGFGMQNLLKNLISGIMVILERPFRLGDLIEVAGIRGEVTDINVRASTVRDINGIETLIPNSTFVEQNVTNWTYSSQRVRFTVKVGVAYGSPVRTVRELLASAAARHGRVLSDPSPEVLFEDFATDALLFSLNYWLELAPDVHARVVASDLRFMIEEAFAAAGIVVAYPQRDVHLDLAGPLQVQMMPAAQSSAPDSTGATR